MIDVNEVKEIVIGQEDKPSAIEQVNTRLAQGWVLISVTQRGYLADGEAYYSTVYTLGRKK